MYDSIDSGCTIFGPATTAALPWQRRIRLRPARRRCCGAVGTRTGGPPGDGEPAQAHGVLLTVRLPLLLPAFTAAFGLSFALSMDELGATIMVYPPTWRTLPVTIFALSDRGLSLALRP